jgi:hypothetical protein
VAGTAARRGAAAMAPMAISGNLRTMPVADLLQWVSLSDKTGTLVVKGPAFIRRIAFVAGKVAAVSSTDPHEQFGYLLVGWGFLSQQELDTALEQQTQRSQMLGELLVETGRLNRDDMERLLRFRLEEAIYDLMLWDEAEFHFLEQTGTDTRFRQAPLSVEPLLLEGARRADEIRRMRFLVPGPACVPRLIGELPADSPPTRRAIAAACDGRRTLEEVALACRCSTFDVTEAVADGIDGGYASLVGAAAPEPPPPPAEAGWHDLLRSARANLRLDDPLQAYHDVAALEDRFALVPAALAEAAQIRDEIAAMIEKGPMAAAHGVAELTAPLAELAHVNLGSDEAFAVTRVNGRFTLAQVLAQLPGPRLYGLVLLHNLMQRGLLRLRSS